MPLHNLAKWNHLSELDNLPVGEIFEGEYRLSNMKIDSNQNGSKYAQIELHDATGVKVGQVHPSEIEWYKKTPSQRITIKGFVLSGDKQRMIHVTEVTPGFDIKTVEPLRLLPRVLCVDPSWLDRLINIRQSITSPALGNFLNTVFSDDKIAFPFLQVPASCNHHHNDPGGLLEHSVEVAEKVALHYYRNTDERDIAVVAALLHDIGKVKTLKTNSKSTILGKMVAHDALTLEICANALQELEKVWPDASYTLRHVWTCASPGARYGFKSMCLIADIVRNADNQSCSDYDIQNAFQHKLVKTGLVWAEHKQQYLWRPTAEPGQLNGAKYAKNSIQSLTKIE